MDLKRSQESEVRVGRCEIHAKSAKSISRKERKEFFMQRTQVQIDSKTDGLKDCRLTDCRLKTDRLTD